MATGLLTVKNMVLGTQEKLTIENILDGVIQPS